MSGNKTPRKEYTKEETDEVLRVVLTAGCDVGGELLWKKESENNPILKGRTYHSLLNHAKLLLAKEGKKLGEYSPKKHKVKMIPKQVLAAHLYEFSMEKFDVNNDNHWKQFAEKYFPDETFTVVKELYFRDIHGQFSTLDGLLPKGMRNSLARKLSFSDDENQLHVPFKIPRLMATEKPKLPPRGSKEQYSEIECKAIIQGIVSLSGYALTGGNKLWIKLCEENEALRGRSWQSVKHKFNTCLYPKLKEYVPEVVVKKFRSPTETCREFAHKIREKAFILINSVLDCDIDNFRTHVVDDWKKVFGPNWNEFMEFYHDYVCGNMSFFAGTVTPKKAKEFMQKTNNEEKLDDVEDDDIDDFKPTQTRESAGDLETSSSAAANNVKDTELIKYYAPIILKTLPTSLEKNFEKKFELLMMIKCSYDHLKLLGKGNTVLVPEIDKNLAAEGKAVKMVETILDCVNSGKPFAQLGLGILSIVKLIDHFSAFTSSVLPAPDTSIVISAVEKKGREDVDKERDLKALPN